jgi:hypothetical protein
MSFKRAFPIMPAHALGGWEADPLSLAKTTAAR